MPPSSEDELKNAISNIAYLSPSSAQDLLLEAARHNDSTAQSIKIQEKAVFKRYRNTTLSFRSSIEKIAAIFEGYQNPAYRYSSGLDVDNEYLFPRVEAALKHIPAVANRYDKNIDLQQSFGTKRNALLALVEAGKLIVSGELDKHSRFAAGLGSCLASNQRLESSIREILEHMKQSEIKKVAEVDGRSSIESLHSLRYAPINETSAKYQKDHIKPFAKVIKLIRNIEKGKIGLPDEDHEGASVIGRECRGGEDRFEDDDSASEVEVEDQVSEADSSDYSEDGFDPYGNRKKRGHY